jgi:hypothetical protein
MEGKAKKTKVKHEAWSKEHELTFQRFAEGQKCTKCKKMTPWHTYWSCSLKECTYGVRCGKCHQEMESCGVCFAQFPQEEEEALTRYSFYDGEEADEDFEICLNCSNQSEFLPIPQKFCDKCGEVILFANESLATQTTRCPLVWNGKQCNAELEKHEPCKPSTPLDGAKMMELLKKFISKESI